MNIINKLELIWYKINGRFKDRITTDNTGQKYVISDWSWNKRNPGHRNEKIEHRIKYPKTYD